MKRIILTLVLALAATAVRSSQCTSVLSDSPGSDTPLAVVAVGHPYWLDFLFAS